MADMTTKTSKKAAAPKKQKERKRLVLLDTHAILHRAYHALPDFTSPKGEPTGALYGLVAMILSLINDLKPDYIAACLDLPGPTHRHEAFEAYKGKREKTDDALVAQIIRARDVFLALGIPMYDMPGFEADDMLGTIAERAKGEVDIIIASGDMDTLQLVDKNRVQVYTLRKGLKDTVLYDEASVMARYGFGPQCIIDYKGLRGDPSDNIPGIMGIGEKTATDLIVNFGSIEDIYKKLKKNEAAFLEVGIRPRIVELLKAGEEEALFSKALATIHIDAPITFALPEKTWKENIDVERTLALFAEFGFRTLAQRIRDIFALGSEQGEVSGVEAAEDEVVDQDVLEETALALWLIESDSTNPGKSEILEFGRQEKAQGFEATRTFILERLTKEGLSYIYETIELPLRHVLKAMSAHGILLDVAYLKELSEVFHTELSALERAIYEHAGQEFNINSPKQLGEVLFDALGLGGTKQKRTATGQRTTKESELEKLRGEHPIIESILRYRELQKLCSTYVDNLPHMVGDDGRVHTTFLQSGAVTGRMATTNPSLQNIPVKTEEGKRIRRAFVAAPGTSILSIDYSQIELRIAAMLSGDERLIEIFKSGQDVHTAVAAQVFRVDEKEVTSDMRRRAKVINFGILYGMGVNALRQNLGEGTSRADADAFLTAYFHTFTRLAEYLEETKAYARKHGYTETFFGRRRHFPGIKSTIPYIKASAERMAINAPIQGTQADVIRIAMVRIAEELKKPEWQGKVAMLLQVHDELLFEVAHKSVDDVVPVIQKIMSEVLTEKDTKGVPITTEAAVGPNWGELKRV
ncbi:MAG: polymerase polymerase protein [Candidatus Parcubacteria bacterium]|jgi:DNA polymerase-1